MELKCLLSLLRTSEENRAGGHDDAPVENIDVLYGELSPLLFNGTWVSNRHICYRDTWGGISLFDAANISSQSLMPNETFVIAKFISRDLNSSKG
ncbi:hypothetical protein TSAR_006762 [Trichomalopsis sarcophagae]|uniref:Uncharacterized protein n=1 Tax=Trichomalopsis sarcophagae TaxID=543379 RepID=A0A232FM09_9HYME|nr:hypothetical protein TSAR_006762 [Trichomalopsis sarcophagae]